MGSDKDGDIVDAYAIDELMYCWSCHRIFPMACHFTDPVENRKIYTCPHCNSTDAEPLEDVDLLMDLEDLQIIGEL